MARELTKQIRALDGHRRLVGEDAEHGELLGRYRALREVADRSEDLPLHLERVTRHADDA